MGLFHDLIDTLGVGDDGVSVAYPDTFRDDITSAYDGDLSGHAAKIEVLEADNALLKAELTAVKAHNYELLKATEPVEHPEDDQRDKGEEEEPAGTDSLFGDDTDKDK